MPQSFIQNYDTAKAMRAVIAVALTLLVLAVFPFTPTPATDIKLLFVHWTAVPLAILLAWRALQRNADPRGLLTPLLAAFVAANMLAGLLSQHPGNSLAETGRLVSFLIIFLAASRAYSDAPQIRRLFMTVCIAAAIASAYGFLQYAGLDPFPWDARVDSRNLPATFGNANFAGHALVLVLIIAAYLAAAQKSRVALALLPVFALHLFLTHHRGGMLGAAAAIATVAALLAAKRLSHFRGARLASVAVTGIAIIGALAAVIVAPGRVLPLDASLLLRYNSFYSASRMIAARPVLGYGPGNYEIENVSFWTPQEQEHYARNHKLNDHPHCELLYAGASGGLPAAGLFLAIVVTGFVAAAAGFWRAKSSASRSLSLMFAAFITAWFIDGLVGFNFKAPVSGALFVAVAGIFDQTTSLAPTLRARWPFARAAVLVVAAAVFAVVATRAFTAAVLLYSANSDIHWRSFGSAEKTLQQAEALDPSNWEISYVRAHACSSINGNDQAAACLQRALDKNPNYLPALIDLAKHNLNQSLAGSTDTLPQAEAAASRALDLCKRLPEALDILGTATLLRATKLTEQDQQRAPLLDQARSYFVDAIARGADKKNRLHDLIGQTYAFQQNFTAAEAEFKKAATFTPPEIPVWQSYRQLGDRTGNYDGLIASLMTAVAEMQPLPGKYNETLAAASLELAEIARKTGDNKLACSSYHQAVQLQPDQAAIWQAYFAAATALRRFDQFFADAAAFNPRLFSLADPAFHAEYARHLRATAGPGKAREHLIKALQSPSFNDAAKNLLQKELAALAGAPVERPR